MHRARIAQLSTLARYSEPQRVLIVGEGDGRFLVDFLYRFPDASVTVVEPSSGMVAEAQSRLSSAGLSHLEIHFIERPLLEADLPAASFDLIVTLFFLDNFDEPEVDQCLRYLSACALPSAYWMVSDFCLPPSGWQRQRARLWLWFLYRFFRMATGLSAMRLPAIEERIDQAGLRRVTREGLCGGMLFSALYQVTRSAS